MKNAFFVALAVVALLLAGLVGSVALAQHSGHGGPSASAPAIPVARTGKARGSIVEVSKTSITLKARQKQGEREDTFQIGDHTRVKGDPAVGADAVVQFREEGGVKVATVIEVKKAKRAKKA